MLTRKSLNSNDTTMKARNLNSLCSCRVACRMVFCCVGLLMVVLGGGPLVLSLQAQNASITGSSTKLSQVAVKASEAKSLGATKAATQSQVTNSPVATIEQVQLSGKDQKTQVRVDGTGPLTYKAFRLNEPDRLVIDFSGAVVRVQERSLSSSLFPVRLVRIGQFQPNVARVVIEIAEQLPYTIAASKNAVTVVFNPATVAKPPITTDKEMPSVPAVMSPKPVVSASTNRAENNQGAKPLTEISMQTAMAPLSDLRDEPSLAALELQTVQVQSSQPLLGSSHNRKIRIHPDHSLLPYLVHRRQLSALRKRFLAMSSGRMMRSRSGESRHLRFPTRLDNPVLIGTNGDITLPLIGRVKAGGLTVEQLEDGIERTIQGVHPRTTDLSDGDRVSESASIGLRCSHKTWNSSTQGAPNAL